MGLRRPLGGGRQHPLRRHHDPADPEHGQHRSAPEQIRTLWWSLALGACLGGNGTLVGASANLVVAGFAERAGQPIRFLPFMLMAFPLMLASIAVSSVYLWLRYL